MSTTLRDLPLAGQAPRRERSQEWLRVARRARLLSWLSLAWMGTEGIVGIAAGVLAGSIALTGFGVNAFVEGFASVVIVWRFSGTRLHSERAEARAHRIVAVQFFVLAPYVTYEAISKLWHGDRPETSWLGIALVATSAIGMPLLGRAKRELAHKLGSGATHGEGTQNILCGYLACSETPCSAGGGSTRSQHLQLQGSRSARGAGAGAARAAAALAADGRTRMHTCRQRPLLRDRQPIKIAV